MCLCIGREARTVKLGQPELQRSANRRGAQLQPNQLARLAPAPVFCACLVQRPAGRMYWHTVRW